MILKNRRTFYPIYAALGIIIIWQISVHILSIPKYMLPGPYVVIEEIYSKAYFLFRHSLVTLYESLFGLVLAIMFAIPASIVVVWFERIERMVMPLMVFFKTVPMVAIAPLFIIWFGFGTLPKVLISILLAYFPIVVELITGLRAVEPEFLDLMKSISASRLQTFIKLQIPNSLPYLFTGMKMASLLSLSGAITAEFMGSKRGLGYLILSANNQLETTLLFASLVVLLFIGKLLFSLMEWIERYLLSWHVVMRGKEEIPLPVQ